MMMSDLDDTANGWETVDPLTLNEAAALWAEEDPPLVWIDDPADPQYAAHALPIDSFKRPALFKRLLVNLCEAVYLNQTLEFQRESNVHAPAINFNEIFRELREKHRKSRHTATPLKPTYFWPARLHDNDGEVTNDYDDYNPDPNHTTVSREELSKWALKIGQNPKFLKNEIVRLTVPAYVNPDHEYCSRELRIAIETWQHFFEKGNFRSSEPSVPQIEAFLKASFSDQLSAEGIKRLCTVINPDSKKAGRTRRE